MSDVVARIAAWQAAGLIDPATADRLRAAEAGRTPATPDATIRAAVGGGSPAPKSAGGPSRVSGMFVGPSITIPEVFGYLGTAFLLAAWTAWTMRGSLDSGSRVPGAAALLAAGGLIVLGLVLRRGPARRSRAAGVAFLVATAYVGVGAAALAGTTSLTPEEAGLIAAGSALVVAVVLRAIHPSVLTQIGLLAAITGLAATILIWFQATFMPTPPLEFDQSGLPLPRSGGTDPMVQLIASAVWWLCSAVVIGLIGLREARAADRGDEAAARRAAVSRFWAGMVAVIGLANAITRSDFDDATGESRRVLSAWLGELALLILSLVLLERAFRRDSTAYVYAAALGLIVALSDFNLTYLSDSTEIGLAIEGAILLGVGLGADRLRRRIGHGSDFAAHGADGDDVARWIEDLPSAGAGGHSAEVPEAAPRSSAGSPDPAGGQPGHGDLPAGPDRTDR